MKITKLILEYYIKNIDKYKLRAKEWKERNQIK